MAYNKSHNQIYFKVYKGFIEYTNSDVYRGNYC